MVFRKVLSARKKHRCPDRRDLLAGHTKTRFHGIGAGRYGSGAGEWIGIADAFENIIPQVKEGEVAFGKKFSDGGISNSRYDANGIRLLFAQGLQSLLEAFVSPGNLFFRKAHLNEGCDCEAFGPSARGTDGKSSIGQLLRRSRSLPHDDMQNFFV